MTTYNTLEAALTKLATFTATGEALRTRLLWLVTETSVDIHTAVYAD